MVPASKHAFTLIEVLLVIAVVALTAAILFPVLAYARRASRRSVCTSNLRQIGLAYQTYHADYGAYPDPMLVTGGLLKDYRILYCPDDTSAGLTGVASSYVYKTDVPPDFHPLRGSAEVDPNTVLVACQVHARRYIVRATERPGERPVYSEPDWPFHLVLRAQGSVAPVHVSRLRKLPVPGQNGMSVEVYPDEPGYERGY